MKNATTSRLFSAAAMVAGLVTLLVAPVSSTKADTTAKAAPAPSINGDWTVDPAHTSVNFSIKHMGLSVVHGRFGDVAGSITADSKNLGKSTVQFTIQTTSINTDNGQRDTHLKSADFFDVAKFPTITFQSTHISKAKGGYVATGNLTVKGVTKTVRLPFTIEGPIAMPAQMGGGARFGLVTNTTIKRSDYGVGMPKYGPPMLGDDVTVEISLEAVTAKK